ncbi:MAG TPA: hypothetical protein PLD05_13670, partial [Thermogutta sp.]|nr:hypothetical protein [Thermogutta sp.]
MRSKLAVNILIAICVLASGPLAWADWMSEYCGYSAFASNRDAAVTYETDGYVSFAVWDRGSPSGDLPTLPRGAEYMVWIGSTFERGTPTGRYIYFYQVVNAQDGRSALKDFRIFDLGFIQVGFVDNAVFQDSQGPVLGSGNVALDNQTSGHPIRGDDQVDGKPTLSGIPPAGLANANGNSVAPTSIDVNVNSGYTQWYFVRGNQGIRLDQANTSYLLFATSDLRPTYKASEERDGNTANCDVPATPEPGSL